MGGDLAVDRSGSSDGGGGGNLPQPDRHEEQVAPVVTAEQPMAPVPPPRLTVSTLLEVAVVAFGATVVAAFGYFFTTCTG